MPKTHVNWGFSIGLTPGRADRGSPPSRENPRNPRLVLRSALNPRVVYNSRMKECPLCGEIMRLSVREIREDIPGRSQATARHMREWTCPECDYFEEAEAGEG